MEHHDNIKLLGAKIKERFDNNIYLSYIASLWNKYKFIVLIILAIILITFIEIKIATCASDCSYMLDKQNIMKISPPCLNLPEGIYLYVYSAGKYNTQDVYNKTGINGYNKLIVGEHITDQISHPVNKIKEGFKHILTSGTPINTLTNNIVNGYKLKDVINPMNSFNNFDSSWRVLYPNGVHLNCFTSNGVIYFSK